MHRMLAQARHRQATQGPSAADQADVSQAEGALQRATADLANTELRAPFTGAITSLKVNPGEMALPGQAVLTLADLSRLRVETTDLSERDVARVAVGQAVKRLCRGARDRDPRARGEHRARGQCGGR